MEKPLYEDINYLHGRLHAVEALVLGMANLLLDKEQFREESIERLRLCRDALLVSPVPETMLLGVDHVENWLKSVTR